MPRPKGSVNKKTSLPRSMPHRCGYERGEEKCNELVKRGKFCSQHSVPRETPEQVAEAVILGPEVAAALRSEVGLDSGVVDSRRHEQLAASMERVQREIAREMTTEAPVEEPRVVQQKPVGEKKAAPPTGPKENPVAAATRLAMDQVAKQYQNDMDDREQRRGEAAMRMSPTDQARMGLRPYFPTLPDLAEMVDSEGNSLVKPGWIPRWVQVKDHQGKATTRRLRQFYLMGAEPVIDENGKELEDVLGKAIQIPPQAYAAWILHKSSSGAFDSSPYVKNAMSLADDINRKAGRNLVDVRPMSGHGTSREDEAPYGS